LYVIGVSLSELKFRKCSVVFTTIFGFGKFQSLKVALAKWQVAPPPPTASNEATGSGTTCCIGEWTPPDCNVPSNKKFVDGAAFSYKFLHNPIRAFCTHCCTVPHNIENSSSICTDGACWSTCSVHQNREPPSFEGGTRDLQGQEIQGGYSRNRFIASSNHEDDRQGPRGPRKYDEGIRTFSPTRSRVVLAYPIT
jgi:hypothetical protein